MNSPRGAPLAAVDRAASAGAPLAVRFACLVDAAMQGPEGGAGDPFRTGDTAAGALDTAVAAFCARLRAPAECRDLALLLCRERVQLLAAAGCDAAALVSLLERCDALRRPDRFDALLLACACAAGDEATAASASRWRQALQAARAIDMAAVAARAAHAGQRGPAVGAAISAARVAAVAAALGEQPPG